MMLEFPDINPVIISFGSLAISWYSLSYVTGIILGWFYAVKLVAVYDIGISKKNIEDFITWIIIGIIIGGRLGHVIFYDPVKYLVQPIDVLKTYEGGMSFHGGIVGYIIASFLFARKNNIKFLALTDISAAAAPIGLCLGRIANFINSELYGKVTDVSWSFVFPNSDGLPRHPSQLYEAGLEGVVLFLILFFAIRHKFLNKTGVISGLFLIFYAIFRVIAEFFREAEIEIEFIAGKITMGQILCIPMLLAGLYLIMYQQRYANRFTNQKNHRS